MLDHNEIPCRNYDVKCNSTTKNEAANVQMRYDAYGFETGYYCEHCYENKYPYRRDKYFDASFAGERLEDDY